MQPNLTKRLVIRMCLLCLLTALGAFVCVAAPTRRPFQVISDSPNSLRKPTTQAEKIAFLDELPRPAAFDGTPSAIGHYGSPKQASTWMRGPKTNRLDVQVLDFKKTLGKSVGTSPWHVVSTRRYREPGAVTVWGASLTDAYRVVVDGDRFDALDRFTVNMLPVSVPWNLAAVDNGRVIVPDPNGRALGLFARDSTSGPTFLVLTDDPKGTGRLDGGIQLEGAIELSETELQRVCIGARGELKIGPSGVFLIPTFSGEMATIIVFSEGDRDQTYLVILDPTFRPISAGYITDTSPSNDTAAEPLGESQTAFYVPTDHAIVKLVFDARTNTVHRRWERCLPIRGRTGTTPSLMNTPDGQRFILIVDAKAAVTSGLNGLIGCSKDTRPSSLVAVQRDDDLDGRPETLKSDLPDYIRAVENSPAVRGDTIVIANYSGYLPNGLIVPPVANAHHSRPRPGVFRRMLVLSSRRGALSP